MILLIPLMLQKLSKGTQAVWWCSWNDSCVCVSVNLCPWAAGVGHNRVPEGVVNLPTV